MTDSKITMNQLTSASEIAADAIFIVRQGGQEFKVSAEILSDFVREEAGGVIGDDITVDTTFAVPGDYDTVLECWEFLLTKFIRPNILVEINVDDGITIHDDALKGHPQGRQVTVNGAAFVGSAFDKTDFVITGNGPAQRTVDKAAHLLVLQAALPTQITCNATSFVDNRKGGHGPNLNNILVYTNNAPGVASYLYNTLNYYDNVVFFGFDGPFTLTNNGNVRASGSVGFVGSGGFGIQVSDNSDFKQTAGAFTLSNASHGFYGKRMCCMELAGSFSMGNGGDGFNVDDFGIMEAASAYSYKNAGTGFKTVNGMANLSCSGSTSEENGVYGYGAIDGGTMTAFNTHAINNVNFGFVATGTGNLNAKNSTSDGNSRGYSVGNVGAFINAPNSVAQNSDGIGYYAKGGKIEATGADAISNGLQGFYAEEFGHINAPLCVATTNGSHGIEAIRYGKINANGASVTSNTGIGVYILDFGEINFFGGTSRLNTMDGLNITDGGHMNAEAATVNSNTLLEAKVTAVGTMRITGTGIALADTNAGAFGTPYGTGNQAIIYN